MQCAWIAAERNPEHEHHRGTEQGPPASRVVGTVSTDGGADGEHRPDSDGGQNTGTHSGVAENEDGGRDDDHCDQGGGSDGVHGEGRSDLRIHRRTHFLLARSVGTAFMTPLSVNIRLCAVQTVPKFVLGSEEVQQMLRRHSCVNVGLTSRVRQPRVDA